MARLPVVVLVLLGFCNLGVIQCQECEISMQDQSQIEAVADGNLEFALGLYKGLSENENAFFSPFSITVALGMVLAGAKSNTLSQMKSTLNLNSFSNESQINQAFKAVLSSICSNNHYTLSTANKIYAQNSFPILQPYLDVLSKSYQSSAENVDFASNADAVAQQINSWVEQRTNNFIKDLFASGSLTPNTILVLVNAIYFKGVWQTKFQTKDTTSEDFTLSSGQIVSTPIMKIRNDFYYAENDQLNCKVLKMDYSGDRLAMYIVLPNQSNGLSTLKNQLTSELFKHLINSLELEEVKVKLPSFKLNFKEKLNDLLQKLGMTDLFSPSIANLSGISNPKNGRLSVSSVIHQAYVSVDEAGTTAAAATGISIVKTLAIISESRIRQFYAVHPFIFVIYDTKTNLILFMGNLDSPTA